jgi:RNA polymerase sigma-70 factor (ECF subfamily)
MVQRQTRLVVDDERFEDLYRREVRSMVALAASMTGSREAAADLVHEAMLRAHRDWTAVAVMDRPGAWLRRVVVNLCTDWLRRNGRERRALARLPRPAVVAAPEASTGQFWRAVRDLPERQRAAVALHYLDDLSVDDIADILDISPGTVKASLFKARRSLARTLGAEEVTT